MINEKIDIIIDRYINFRPYNLEKELYFNGVTEAKYHFASSFIAEKNVIEVGCSLGCGTYYLAKRRPKKIIGIDYASAAIFDARKNYNLPNLSFEVLSAGKIGNFISGYDVVIAIEMIEHLKEEEIYSFLGGVRKILDSNGMLILSTPNKLITSPEKEKPSNPLHFLEFKPEDLHSLLMRYFSEVKILGMRCINAEYLKKERGLKENNVRYNFLKNLGKYRMMKGMAAFIPMNLRKIITGEVQLPEITISDFKIDDQDIKNADTLFAICQK